AVGRSEDAALVIRSVRMPERRDEQAIGIPGVDQHRGNLPRLAEAEMLPCPSGVGRFVDPVADGQVRPLQPLAARHVYDVGVRGRDRDGADRLRGLIVEDRAPCQTVVGRLPDTAVVHADIKDVWLLRDAGSAYGPAAAEWPDVAPAQCGVP